MAPPRNAASISRIRKIPAEEHLALQNVADVLQDRHESARWLDFITGKLCR